MLECNFSFWRFNHLNRVVSVQKYTLHKHKAKKKRSALCGELVPLLFGWFSHTHKHKVQNSKTVFVCEVPKCASCAVAYEEECRTVFTLHIRAVLCVGKWNKLCAAHLWGVLSISRLLVCICIYAFGRALFEGLSDVDVCR